MHPMPVDDMRRRIVVVLLPMGDKSKRGSVSGGNVSRDPKAADRCGAFKALAGKESRAI